MLKVLLTALSCLYGFISFSQEQDSTRIQDSFPTANMADTASVSDALSAIVRDNSKILLSWRSLSHQNEFFTIERSCNGKEYETIGVLKQVPGASKLEWTDEQPAYGKNVYRIRYSFTDGTQWYTRSVLALVSGGQSFRFYPNPVDNLLIIRSEQPVDISILDANGKTRISQTVSNGLQMLNVTTLEKGVYLLRIYNKQTNTVQQEKLVKN